MASGKHPNVIAWGRPCDHIRARPVNNPWITTIDFEICIRDSD